MYRELCLFVVSFWKNLKPRNGLKFTNQPDNQNLFMVKVTTRLRNWPLVLCYPNASGVSTPRREYCMSALDKVMTGQVFSLWRGWNILCWVLNPLMEV